MVLVAVEQSEPPLRRLVDDDPAVQFVDPKRPDTP
jgi:hypothetical protein